MFELVVISTSRMQQIVEDIGSRDPRFAEVVSAHPLCPVGQSPATLTHFESLVESVISQQLSVTAADTILGRFKSLIAQRVTPEFVLQISENEMRAAGVSGAKFRTIHGLANAAVTGRININSLHEIDDDAVISQQLLSLWGIGTWTVDMFMMHQLGRLDVWPTGDVGVRRGWEKIYSLVEPIAPQSLHLAGEKFSPYRSVVAWYCWQAGDM
jgi:DNA-3-methyladenine glycosylase II